MSTRLTDEDLVAFLHGELGAEQSAAVEAALDADPNLSERVEMLAGQDDLIRSAFAPVLHADVPDRLQAIVVPPAGGAEIVDLAAARSRRRTGWGLSQFAAMAASLVLGLFLGDALLGGSLLRPAPAVVVASADGLQISRDVQAVLSDTPSGRSTRIAGLGEVDVAITFKANDGRLCRQFSLQGAAGIDDAVGCRAEDRQWRLEALGRRPEAGGEMRTAAGDAAPAVVSAVDALITSEPLVGDAEIEALRK